MYRLLDSQGTDRNMDLPPLHSNGPRPLLQAGWQPALEN